MALGLCSKLDRLSLLLEHRFPYSSVLLRTGEFDFCHSVCLDVMSKSDILKIIYFSAFEQMINLSG